MRFAGFGVVPRERRGSTDRRQVDRRTPGELTDVTRVEHENLFRVVEELLRKTRDLESAVRSFEARLAQLDGNGGPVSRRAAL